MPVHERQGEVVLARTPLQTGYWTWTLVNVAVAFLGPAKQPRVLWEVA